MLLLLLLWQRCRGGGDIDDCCCNGGNDIDGFVALGNQNKKLNINGINIKNIDLSKITDLTPNFSSSDSKAGNILDPDNHNGNITFETDAAILMFVAPF